MGWDMKIRLRALEATDGIVVDEVEVDLVAHKATNVADVVLDHCRTITLKLDGSRIEERAKVSIMCEHCQSLPLGGRETKKRLRKL